MRKDIRARNKKRAIERKAKLAKELAREKRRQAKNGLETKKNEVKKDKVTSSTNKNVTTPKKTNLENKK